MAFQKMSKHFQLTLKGTPYSQEELKNGDTPQPHSEFEKATLAFCQAWLTGQQNFYIETSGSTGTPKKIVLHRSHMEASARLTEKALNLQANFNSLLCLDPRYIAGQMMLVRGMVTGMNVVAIEPCANPLAKIQGVQIDFAAVVPYQLHAILSSSETKIKLNSLKCLLIGGSPLDAPTIDILNDLACSCYASYGMTETLTHIALQKLNGENRQDFFQTLEGVTVSIDQRDCLIIHAPHIGDAEIITNDMVEILSPTKFRWLGRFDHVINSGGVKLIPEKIEKAIEPIFAGLHLSNRYFVSSYPHATLGEQVVLIIEGSVSAKTVAQLSQLLNAQLSRYEIPKEIKMISKFEFTSTGKTDRGKTRSLALRNKSS